MARISKASRSRWLSPTFLLACALIILITAGTVYILYERHVAQTTVTTTSQESLIVPAIGPNDHVLGPLNAPVELIVYADLSCQYCNRFFISTMPSLQAQFGGKIAIVYRHLPLPEHPNSTQEAYVAECVAQIAGNSDFWKFVHGVLTSPGYLNGLDLPALESIAAEYGVDKDRLSACVNSGASKQVVDQESLQASVAGITETPSVVFKSATRALIVQGDYPSQYVTAIQYLLANSTSTTPY